MAPTVWTPRRKWLGNLIPLIVWAPITALGLWRLMATHDFTGPGLWLVIGANGAAWLALNQFGLFENGRMKGQLARILSARGDAPQGDRWFVGFASPQFTSALDAHEDVGFLYLLTEKVIFVSETRTLEIARLDIVTIGFRPNVHSFVGLGRWITLEGKIGSKAIRMNVEPRERRTLLGNRRESALLLARLKKWAGK